MPIPGFDAELSLGIPDRSYRTTTRVGFGSLSHRSSAGVVVASAQLFFRRPPPGLCAKACSLCRNPAAGGGWCNICDRCFDDF